MNSYSQDTRTEKLLDTDAHKRDPYYDDSAVAAGGNVEHDLEVTRRTWAKYNHGWFERAPEVSDHMRTQLMMRGHDVRPRMSRRKDPR